MHALAAEGWSGREFGDAESMLEALDSDATPSVVVTDLRMPGSSGLELLTTLRQRLPELPVILMTAWADLDNSVAALTGGAFELLPKPFDLDEAVDLIRRARGQRHSPEPAAIAPDGETPALIGSAPAMKEVFRVIGRLSGSDLGVLICGESGTGKERVARALHQTSKRTNGPFVALNVPALPADLLESELFGHEKGAFSGASEARAGYFEQAAGGTLFLDEIGEMPHALQTRLLRVLAEGEFQRLGSTRARRADVRLIAATNRDLAAAVEQGRFREDLYYRLNVVELTLPPLRERREDIGALLDHYLAAAARELGQGPKRLDAAARNRLEAHEWPGNVRELVNLCRRLSVLVPGPEIHLDDLPLDPVSEDDEVWTDALARWAAPRLHGGEPDLMPEAVRRLERCLIEQALRVTGGRRAEAARLLGIGRNTLARKVGTAD